jgi:hypothetical protein
VSFVFGWKKVGQLLFSYYVLLFFKQQIAGYTVFGLTFIMKKFAIVAKTTAWIKSAWDINLFEICATC